MTESPEFTTCAVCDAAGIDDAATPTETAVTVRVAGEDVDLCPSCVADIVAASPVAAILREIGPHLHRAALASADSADEQSVDDERMGLSRCAQEERDEAAARRSDAERLDQVLVQIQPRSPS